MSVHDRVPTEWEVTIDPTDNSKPTIRFSGARDAAYCMLTIGPTQTTPSSSCIVSVEDLVEAVRRVAHHSNHKATR